MLNIRNWKKNSILSEHDFDDKTIKVIYNASAYEKEEDSLIKDFLHYIYTDKPDEVDLSNRLSRLVEKCKEDENLRSDYLAMNLHDHDIRYEALQEGAQKKAVEAARSFYANGASIELIAKSLKMTEAQVLQIVNEPLVVKA